MYRKVINAVFFQWIIPNCTKILTKSNTQCSTYSILILYFITLQTNYKTNPLIRILRVKDSLTDENIARVFRHFILNPGNSDNSLISLVYLVQRLYYQIIHKPKRRYTFVNAIVDTLRGHVQFVWRTRCGRTDGSGQWDETKGTSTRFIK